MISTRLYELVRRHLPTLLAPAALLLLSALPGNASGQGFGPDPFRPYNSQYDPYVFGVAPGAYDAGGNATLNRAGVRNANQFQNFLEGLDERGNRYDRANRAYDRDYNRLYKPNSKADARFENRRNEVSDVYFRYLREKDPRKRAALFKEYTQAQNRSARGLSDDPNARGGRRGRTAVDDGLPVAPPLDPVRGRAEAPAPAPALPGEESPRPPDSPRSRRSNRPAAPAPPATTGPAPSEVLDRALRSDDATVPPAPPLTP
ncbi:hypothetical protein [Planctomyces sp. SH-PL62]|uniref:hypothetical protein n=1 Tax=Planctomyces sp. SH-PL62 TaxID=1636152 RepID=UPI0008381BE8|nr:hypothetical protein [Planctomyces sp. SH-PL62]